MKTIFSTIITLATVVLSASVSNAATSNNNIGTVNAVNVAVNNINKIEASGNVEVYITNGDKDEVKVYDKYYSQNALVQDKEGVLRIASYGAEKLVVLVTVADLRTVVANDNATIKTYGTLSAADLKVTLNNNASAQLKLDAVVANINVNGRAKADLSGSVDDYSLNYSQSSTINRTELVAIKTAEKNTTKAAAIQAEENMASL